MAIGAGLAPAGLSIAGYGSLDAATALPQEILKDPNGGYQNARRIDPQTGQYVFDASGSVQGMSGVEQLVYLRAATAFNSSVIGGLGMRAPTGVVGPDIARRLTEEITRAMKDLIDQKIIQVVGVTVRKVDGVWRRYFVWRDLTSDNGKAGIEQRTSF